MMVEKVPDSTYQMVGGLDMQIKEIKEIFELPVNYKILRIWCTRYRSAKRSPPVWSSRNREDAACSCGCSSHWLWIYPSFWQWIGTEVYWWGQSDASGPWAVRYGEIACPKYHSHGWNWFNWKLKGWKRQWKWRFWESRMLLELLNQLDGFEPTKNIKVIIMMATNRIGMFLIGFHCDKR